MKLALFSKVIAIACVLTTALAQEKADAPVRNVEDLLRGMPITEGLYSAAKPNPQTCLKATQSLSKVAIGRPIELQFAFDQWFSEYDRGRSMLVIARSLPVKHRHRLDNILVRFEFPLKDHEALRSRLKNGAATAVKGTIKKVEFGPEGNKVLLLVTLGDVTGS